MKRLASKLRGVALATALGLIVSTQVQAGDVFVHLFEWDWNEIATECETFLGPKGFNAVQIFPPNEHIVHDTWWARYQPVSQGRPGGATRCDTAGWQCQHRHPEVANMVGFRNFVQGTGQENWWDNGSNAIAFSRGDKGFVLINNEEQDVKETLFTGLPAGSYCNVLAGADPCSGSHIAVAADGTATFEVVARNAVAIHRGAVAGPVNPKPVAKIADLPSQVVVGTTVMLDAGVSTDDGEIVRYAWSTGEGNTTITRTLNAEGQHTFSVTVTDEQGATDSASVTISSWL